MVMKQTSNEIGNLSRRKAVKTLVGGVTVVAAYHVLPAKWGTPIIEQVFLPAHAATSGVIDAPSPGGTPAPAATYSLAVSVATDRTQCRQAGIFIGVSGTVSASDGSNLTGVQVNINYENPIESEVVDIVVTVGPGNTFTYSNVITAPDGLWDRDIYIVTVSFVDQTAYGTATASTSGSCL
jgi:hypothetical protein